MRRLRSRPPWNQSARKPRNRKLRPRRRWRTSSLRNCSSSSNRHTVTRGATTPPRKTRRPPTRDSQNQAKRKVRSEVALPQGCPSTRMCPKSLSPNYLFLQKKKYESNYNSLTFFDYIFFWTLIWSYFLKCKLPRLPFNNLSSTTMSNPVDVCPHLSKA